MMATAYPSADEASSDEDTGDTQPIPMYSLRNREIPPMLVQGTGSPITLGGGSAREEVDAPEPQDSLNQSSSNRTCQTRSRRKSTDSNNQLALEVNGCKDDMARLSQNMDNIARTLLDEVQSLKSTVETNNQSRLYPQRPIYPACQGVQPNNAQVDQAPNSTCHNNGAPVENALTPTSETETCSSSAQIDDSNDRLMTYIGNVPDMDSRRMLTNVFLEAQRAKDVRPQSTNSHSTLRCKPATYSGDGSWYHYVANVEAVAEANEWPKDKWSVNMKPFLQGNALDWFNELDATKLTDWSYVIKEMGAKLGETPRACLNRVNGIEFAMDADLVKGCAEISMLVKGAFPHLSAYDQDQLVKVQFERALPLSLRKEMATILQGKDSSTEIARLTDNHRRTFYPNATNRKGSVRAIGKSDSNPHKDIQCHNCNNFGHYASTCTKPKAKPTGSVRPNNHHGSNNRQNNNRPNSQSSSSTRNNSNHGNRPSNNNGHRNGNYNNYNNYNNHNNNGNGGNQRNNGYQGYGRGRGQPRNSQNSNNYNRNNNGSQNRGFHSDGGGVQQIQPPSQAPTVNYYLPQPMMPGGVAPTPPPTQTSAYVPAPSAGPSQSGEA